MSGNQLTLSKATFSYDSSRGDAVAGVSLSATGGQVVGLLGRNGAGKSTFLRLVTGLLSPRSGTVSINGTAPHSVRGRERIKLARMALQTPEHQLFRTSVREELMFDARVCGEDPAEFIARAESILNRLGLPRVLEEHPYDLDPWARKLVCIAMALVSRAPVIALDEPTNRLDQMARSRLAELVVERGSEGAVVLVCSHDAEFCMATCTHLVRMRAGTMSELTPAAALWDAPDVASEFNIFTFPTFYLRRAVQRR